MKIHKQAAIKTIKVFLSIISISVLTSLSINFIPMHILLGVFGIALLVLMIYMIYKVSLDQIEWDEKYKLREQEWKKIDSERYTRKMNYHDTK
jgi:uncharacterized membrane protein YfcA